MKVYLKIKYFHTVLKHRILCDFKVKINPALVMHKDAEKYKHIQLKIAKL